MELVNLPRVVRASSRRVLSVVSAVAASLLCATEAELDGASRATDDVGAAASSSKHVEPLHLETGSDRYGDGLHDYF